MGIFSQYLKYLLTGAAVLLMVVAGINYVADPYGVFNSDFIDNDLKPTFETNERKFKFYQMLEITPSTVYIGTSRTDIGLPTAETEGAYNAGLAGASIDEMFAVLKFSHTQLGVKEFILGIDFLSFVAQPYKPGFNLPKWSMNRTAIIGEQLLSLFSLSALDDAVAIVLGSYKRPCWSTYLQGAYTPRWGECLAQTNGQALMFRGAIEAVDSLYANTSEGEIERSLAVFSQMMAYIKANQLRVRLFFSPMHDIRLARITNAYGNTFIGWKGHVLERFFYHFPTHSLHDFAIETRYSQEAVPQTGDKQARMQWFYDASHYNLTYGREILACIKSDNDGLGQVCDAMIHRLETYEAGLQNQRLSYAR